MTSNKYKNSEGYTDMTAQLVLNSMVPDKEEEDILAHADSRRMRYLIKGVKALAESFGFEVEGRIMLRNKRTGKIYC